MGTRPEEIRSRESGGGGHRGQRRQQRWSSLTDQTSPLHVQASNCCSITDDSGVRVLMWNTCVSPLLTHLAVPISKSHHDRIVKELHVSASHRCHFGTCCCSCSSLCSLHSYDPMDGFKQPYSASSSWSSSLCEDEARSKPRPAENQGSRGQCPPWRYWRRTRVEPQHRQPGEQQSPRN